MATLLAGKVARVGKGNLDRSDQNRIGMAAPDARTVGLMFNFYRCGEQTACFCSEGPLNLAEDSEPDEADVEDPGAVHREVARYHARHCPLRNADAVYAWIDRGTKRPQNVGDARHLGKDRT